MRAWACEQLASSHARLQNQLIVPVNEVRKVYSREGNQKVTSTRCLLLILLF